MNIDLFLYMDGRGPTHTKYPHTFNSDPQFRHLFERLRVPHQVNKLSGLCLVFSVAMRMVCRSDR